MSKKQLTSIPKTWYWLKEKYHFIAIVHDGDEEIVVSKRWLKYKSRWLHEATHREVLEWQFKIMEDEVS